jgi:hypothetical protein
MAAPKIESYRFGEIVIDGRRYSNDVIIYPDRVDGKWWREEGHSLVPERRQAASKKGRKGESAPLGVLSFCRATTIGPNSTRAPSRDS